MAYRLEVKYYNSFWLKQVTTPLLSKGTFKTYGKVFPGLPFRDTLIRKFGKIGYLTPTFFNSFPTWPKPFDDYDPTNPAIVPSGSRGYNPYVNRSNVNLKNVAD